jgi:hypothetical protein
MNRKVWIRCAAAVAALVVPWGASFAKTPEDVTTILRRQTQELFDAVTAGDSTVWERWLAPGAVYADEGGELNLRKQLVHSIQPLPKDVSGKLELAQFEVRPHGETAVATFTVNETEVYYGQEIHCRYLSTFVWMRAADQWRVIAAQTLALREDPPAVALAPERLDEYVGEYQLTPEVRYKIRREGAALFGHRTGRPEEALKAELADLFFVPGRPRLRKVFQRGADGKITGFVERREAWDIAWKRRGP